MIRIRVNVEQVGVVRTRELNVGGADSIGHGEGTSSAIHVRFVACAARLVKNRLTKY